MSVDAQKAVGAAPPGWPEELNQLSHDIIGAAIEVHTHLGPGLREAMYERALVLEMRRHGLAVGQQVPFHVIYKRDDLGVQVVDVVVESRVIVECKSMAAVTETDKQQLLGYLRFTNSPLGLLINFNVARLVDGVTRKINWPIVPRSDAVRVRANSSSVLSVPAP
jgi:GxxExxY protein